MGIESRTGRALWQWDVPDPGYAGMDRWPVGVWGDVLVTAVGHGEKLEMAELWSASTGQILDPASTAGRAAIQDAIARAGRSEVYFDDAVIDLNTGSVVKRLPPPLAQTPEFRPAQAFIMCKNANRVFFNIDTDNGQVEHSVYPKYVARGDLQGHAIWQFPRVLKYPGYSSMAAMERNHIWAEAMFPKAGIIAANDAAGDLFGLARTTGRVVWRLVGQDEFAPLVKIGSDGVLLCTDRRARWIARLNPLTGHVWKLVRAADGRLLTADADGDAVVTQQGLVEYFPAGASKG